MRPLSGSRSSHADVHPSTCSVGFWVSDWFYNQSRWSMVDYSIRGILGQSEKEYQLWKTIIIFLHSQTNVSAIYIITSLVCYTTITIFWRKKNHCFIHNVTVLLIINKCYLSSSPFVWGWYAAVIMRSILIFWPNLHWWCWQIHHLGQIKISSGHHICKKTTNMRHSAEDMWWPCFKINTFSRNKIKAYFVTK